MPLPSRSPGATTTSIGAFSSPRCCSWARPSCRSRCPRCGARRGWRGEGSPRLAEPGVTTRYAAWPRRAALAALALGLALIAAAALTPIRAGDNDAAAGARGPAATSATPQVRTRDEDLQLYDDVIARLRHGESYYAVIAEEHRKHRFPLHPGFAVRLPTLAMIEAALPARALAPLSVVLALGVLLAWWRKLGGDPAALPVRSLAMAALLIGVTIG